MNSNLALWLIIIYIAVITVWFLWLVYKDDLKVYLYRLKEKKNKK